MSAKGPEIPDKVLGDFKELPTPKKFVITPVTDGDYRNNLPTVTAVYLGCDDIPQGQDLCRIDWMNLERDEEAGGALHLCLYIPPKDEDAVGGEFGSSFAYELEGSKEVIKQFWESVTKIKCFVFVVSTDSYFFRCRVDTETEHVTDTTCSYRFLL